MLKVTYEGRPPVVGKGGDAGYDLRAEKSYQLYTGQQRLVKTGTKLCIPEGYVGIVKSRSGLSVKHSLAVKAGVIDSNYRGEVGVVLRNEGDLPYSIREDEKIAQILFIACEEVEFLEGDVSRDTTERGEEGYGASGRFVQ